MCQFHQNYTRILINQNVCAHTAIPCGNYGVLRRERQPDTRQQEHVHAVCMAACCRTHTNDHFAQSLTQAHTTRIHGTCLSATLHRSSEEFLRYACTHTVSLARPPSSTIQSSSIFQLTRPTSERDTRVARPQHSVSHHWKWTDSSLWCDAMLSCCSFFLRLSSSSMCLRRSRSVSSCCLTARASRCRVCVRGAGGGCQGQKRGGAAHSGRAGTRIGHAPRVTSLARLWQCCSARASARASRPAARGGAPLRRRSPRGGALVPRRPLGRARRVAP